MVLIVGPSCVGKTTITERLKEKYPNAGELISTTTRPPREGEKEGVHYEFTTGEDFLARERVGGFYETAKYCGHHYGTSRAQVETLLKRYPVVFGVLNVQGCRAVKSRMPDTLVVFIVPGALREIEVRLRARRSATEEEVRKRLDEAREEMGCAHEFGIPIKNVDGELENALAAVANRINERFTTTTAPPLSP